MMDFKKFANKKLCVATSGGADSTALLHYMKSLQNEFGFSLSAVHCEHGIRGQESKEDRDFVVSLCKDWGVPCRVFEADCLTRAKTQKLSLETAAREFRYRCYEELLASGGVDYIALAHHLDDEAETVLFRISRGTSIGGAQGMQPICGKYLRPLLDESKDEILA
jgi:tRNA(Ile)-lysidine synthase